MKNKGFLLLEVLLAVAILSLGLVMVVRSFVTSLRAIKISQDLLTANLLLEEKIWQKQEALTRADKIVFQEEDGKFELPFDKFNYKIDFEKQEDLPLLNTSGLYRTTFEVFWQQKGRKWNTSCVTYVRSKEE